VLENADLLSHFTSIDAHAEDNSKLLYTCSANSRGATTTAGYSSKKDFLKSLVSNETNSEVYYLDDNPEYYAAVEAMGTKFITFDIGSKEAYYETRQVGTENLTVERMKELLVLVVPQYKYSTFIADTCARDNSAPICTHQPQDETNLAALIESMVGDLSNLSIFKKFLTEYGDVAIQYWETVASAHDRPGFGDELLEYLANHKMNQGVIEETDVEVFEKILAKLYTGEKEGDRFEQLLIRMFPAQTLVANGMVRRVVQDTWWRTHRKKNPGLKINPGLKTEKNRVKRLLSRPVTKFQKLFSPGKATPPVNPGESNGSVSERIHEKYGIETVPFQLHQSDGTLTQAVKEVLCYLIINKEWDGAELNRYIEHQYGTVVPLDVLSDKVEDLTNEVGEDVNRTAEAILSVYEEENLTHTTIFAKIEENFKVVFLSDAERLKSTLLEINYIQRKEKERIRRQTISNPILSDNMVYLLILISTYAEWNLRKLITKCRSYNVKGHGNPEASTVVYKPALREMSVIIMNEYSNYPVVLNAIREWNLD